MSATKKYILHGNIVTARDIAEAKEITIGMARRWLKNVPEMTDVTDIICAELDCRSNKKLKERRSFLYHEMKSGVTGIAVASGLPTSTVTRLLKESKSGDVVDSIIDMYAPREIIKFVYRGEDLSMSAIAAKSGKSFGTIYWRLSGVAPLTDVTEIVDSIHGSSRIFIFEGRQMDCNQIAEYLDLSVTVVRRLLEHAEHGTDVTSVFEDKKFKRRTEITVDGVRLTRHAVSVFLNTTDTRDYITSEEYLASRNYSERLKLGFDKASRSTWIIDDLWDYECPVCGKHLLLTTDEIITHEHGEICEEAEI